MGDFKLTSRQCLDYGLIEWYDADDLIGRRAHVWLQPPLWLWTELPELRYTILSSVVEDLDEDKLDFLDDFCPVDQVTGKFFMTFGANSRFIHFTEENALRYVTKRINVYIQDVAAEILKKPLDKYLEELSRLRGDHWYASDWFIRRLQNVD